MPAPTLSRLTLAPGARLKGGFKGRWAAERVISDTTLSLLKPASYAGTFSRDFVSRLRHRAGIVRRETRREGCVRDKQEAQKPTIAPGSGFKPPHSRLQRNENNRQPACPEREAGKGVRRRGQTACCLPSRHSLNGACFCAVKSCSCCARSTRAGGCSRESGMRMVLVLLPSKVQRKPRRCRGCFVPFFRKKVPKNSPADAYAYFVPSNVRNGRPPKRRV